MKKFFSEFKAFALKGNVVDMAVGVIIGGAFGAIMVSGLIIFPALSAMRVSRRFSTVVITSATLALVCFAVGFVGSLILDVQPGPAIITVHVIVFLICCLIGFLRNRIRTANSKKIVVE